MLYGLLPIAFTTLLSALRLTTYYYDLYHLRRGLQKSDLLILVGSSSSRSSSSSGSSSSSSSS